MKLSFRLLLPVPIVLLASLLVPSREADSRNQPAAELCFRVIASDSRLPLSGVEVYMKAFGPAELGLGITDDYGSLCVPKSQLRDEQMRVVLFCRESFFCGAFDLDRPVAGADFLDFDERLIALSPFVLN